MEAIDHNILVDFQKEGNDILNFFKHIDWNENWFRCLLIFHVFMFCLVIISRKKNNFQIGLFLFLIGIVTQARRINTYAQQYYHIFSAHNYFDPNGFFISMTLSAPILLNCLVIIINFIGISSQLLIRVKKLQLQRKQQKRE